jgi:hypothetical protein
MKEFEEELKRIKEEGKLQTVSTHHYSGKKSHKQNVPLTSKKWSLKQRDYVLLRFGFFWEMTEFEERQSLQIKHFQSPRFFDEPPFW